MIKETINNMETEIKKIVVLYFQCTDIEYSIEDIEKLEISTLYNHIKNRKGIYQTELLNIFTGYEKWYSNLNDIFFPSGNYFNETGADMLIYLDNFQTFNHDYIRTMKDLTQQLLLYQIENKQKPTGNNILPALYFFKKIKLDYPNVYTALEKAFQSNFISLVIDDKNKKWVHFDCPTNSVSWFFKEGDCTNWKLISEYCKSKSGEIDNQQLNIASQKTPSKVASDIIKIYY